MEKCPFKDCNVSRGIGSCFIYRIVRKESQTRGYKEIQGNFDPSPGPIWFGDFWDTFTKVFIEQAVNNNCAQSQKLPAAFSSLTRVKEMKGEFYGEI